MGNRGNRGVIMANKLTIYQSVIDDVKDIISSGMESAYNATSRAMVLTYWNVGRLMWNRSRMAISEPNTAQP